MITLFFKPVTPPSQLNARDAIHGVQMAFVASVAVVTAAALVALLGVRLGIDQNGEAIRDREEMM